MSLSGLFGLRVALTFGIHGSIREMRNCGRPDSESNRERLGLRRGYYRMVRKKCEAQVSQAETCAFARSKARSARGTRRTAICLRTWKPKAFVSTACNSPLLCSMPCHSHRRICRSYTPIPSLGDCQSIRVPTPALLIRALWPVDSDCSTSLASKT